MERSRNRAVGVGLVLIAALVFPVGSVSAAKPQPQLTRGPHASPPTGAELERLVALNDHPPVDELAGDITVTVVTHTVHVKLAADEEWRSYYGANAYSTANNAIEAADNSMFTQFGIDLYWYNTANWDSSPDGGDVDACDLLGDLMNDLNPGTSDALIGFAKNFSNNYAGCAEPNGDEAEVNWNSSSYNRWVTTQHEVSHLFGAPDRYGPDADIHTDDVMENQYEDPDFWCTQQNFEDWDIVMSHSMKFD